MFYTWGRGGIGGQATKASLRLKQVRFIPILFVSILWFLFGGQRWKFADEPQGVAILRRVKTYKNCIHVQDCSHEPPRIRRFINHLNHTPKGHPVRCPFCGGAS